MALRPSKTDVSLPIVVTRNTRDGVVHAVSARESRQYRGRCSVYSHTWFCIHTSVDLHAPVLKLNLVPIVDRRYSSAHTGTKN